MWNDEITRIVGRTAAKIRRTSWPLLLTTVVCSLGIIGCQGPFWIDGFPDSRGGSGSLRLELGSISSREVSTRTFKPSEIDSLDIVSYDLSGMGPQEETFNLTDQAGERIEIEELSAGEWTVDVVGKNADGSALVSGSGSVSIVPAEMSELEIPLEFIPGTGTLQLSLSWPADKIAVPTCAVTLTPVGGEAAVVEADTADAASGTLSWQDATLSAGVYTVLLELRDDGRTAWALMEVVYILDGLTTEISFDLTAEQIKYLPAAPSGLEITSSSFDSVSLRWVDNALVETEYTVERKASSDSEFTQLAVLAADVEEYTDTTVSDGTAYEYRVKAGNAWGDSGISNLVTIQIPELLEISGIIDTDTQWTSDNGYIVTGNLLVDSGITLTIGAGTEIRFDGYYYIRVAGTLVARGLEGEEILFSSAKTTKAAGDWDSIEFVDSCVDAVLDSEDTYQSGSIMEHCMVEYAAGITILDSFPHLLDVEVRYCNRAEWPSGSQGALEIEYTFVSADPAKELVVKESSFVDSDIGVGLYLDTDSDCGVRFTGVECSRNETIGLEVKEVGMFDPSMFESNVHLTISDSIFDGNQNGITTSEGLPALTVSGCYFMNSTYQGLSALSDSLIEDTVFENNAGGGLIMIGGIATIRNNTFTDNWTAPYGSAIRLEPSTADSETNLRRNFVYFNTFSGNTGDSVVAYDGGSGVMFETYFVGNNFDDPDADYEFQLVSDDGVTVTDNYWNTSDDTAIAAMIYDFYDDFSLGTVIFEPYRLQAITDTSVVITPLSPSNGGTNTGGSCEFEWLAIGDYSNIHLWVATDSEFTNTVFDENTLSGSSYTLDSLTVPQTYHWKMRLQDAAGVWQDWSPVYSFDTN